MGAMVTIQSQSLATSKEASLPAHRRLTDCSSFAWMQVPERTRSRLISEVQARLPTPLARHQRIESFAFTSMVDLETTESLAIYLTNLDSRGSTMLPFEVGRETMRSTICSFLHPLTSFHPDE